MVAGRCAHIQSEGPVVTGCFDDVFVRNWLSHGDVIISRADVVDVGNSSMLVRVVTSKDVLEDGVRREIECVT